jgi:hypothetical protein
VEELRADLQDHKSMYREQIDMLVKQVRNFRFWQERVNEVSEFLVLAGPGPR